MIFFLMIRRPPRSTLDRSSAASDVYKRQEVDIYQELIENNSLAIKLMNSDIEDIKKEYAELVLSLIHISEPTRPY